MFKTHIAAGFLAGIFAIKYLSPANQIMFMSLILIGAILPDIDHPKSKIGSKFPFVSMFFEHRGFFHSLFVLPAIALVLFYFAKTNYYSLPLIIGYVSHLATDAATKEGVMPLHPLSKARIRGFITTGGFFEYLIFFAIIIFAALNAVKL